jgi:hypothetical protein
MCGSRQIFSPADMRVEGSSIPRQLAAAPMTIFPIRSQSLERLPLGRNTSAFDALH